MVVIAFISTALLAFIVGFIVGFILGLDAPEYPALSEYDIDTKKKKIIKKKTIKK